MVLIRSRTRSSPSAAIFSGVSASANSAGVALLTPASVACAESTTATSSVNGLTCWSSPFGSGLARLEAAKRFLDLRLGPLRQSPCAAFASAAARFGGDFTFARLRMLSDGLAAFCRFVFARSSCAMISVY